MDYLNFDLAIEGRKGKYCARVLESPAGPAKSLFKRPFSDLELENFVLKVSSTARVTRRIELPEAKIAKDFGARLFDTVFAQEIRARLLSSLDLAQERRCGLRIRLRLTSSDLSDLPWEFLYRSELQEFLALGTRTPIVRYMETPQRPPALELSAPLRVLVVISRPAGLQGLDTEKEFENLSAALADPVGRGQVAIDRLPNGRLSTLQQRLRRGTYHVLHFIGHGEFDSARQDGLLAFEDDNGNPDRVSAEHLGNLIHNHPSLRLAVLNSCEGGRTMREDPFAGTAQSLIQRGLPAVIAMQFEISDDAAKKFAAEFYTALADGYPVDTALVEARVAINTSLRGLEWATPVLYTRSPDGQLFDIGAPLAPRTPVADSLHPPWLRRVSKLTARRVLLVLIAAVGLPVAILLYHRLHSKSVVPPPRPVHPAAAGSVPHPEPPALEPASYRPSEQLRGITQWLCTVVHTNVLVQNEFGKFPGLKRLTVESRPIVQEGFTFGQEWIVKSDNHSVRYAATRPSDRVEIFSLTVESTHDPLFDSKAAAASWLDLLGGAVLRTPPPTPTASAAATAPRQAGPSTAPTGEGLDLKPISRGTGGTGESFVTRQVLAPPEAGWSLHRGAMEEREFWVVGVQDGLKVIAVRWSPSLSPGDRFCGIAHKSLVASGE